MNVKYQAAGVARAQEEVRKLVGEQREPTLDALVAWLAVVLGMTIGAALFGAGMAFAKALGL